MEIIFLSGYTENEKIAIANGYLIPRQLRENGLLPDEVSFSLSGLQKIIRSYTYEAGVRNLEREIGSICRKIVTRVAEAAQPAGDRPIENKQAGENGKSTPTEVNADKVVELLGRPHYFGNEEIAQRTSVPGVATGLSVTPAGGEVLFIEATSMPGGKGFQITGSIGNVMQESAQAALSYIRSKAVRLDLPADFFDKTDIHLHVPAGAQPKDGPSAGVTMATALASLISGRPVRSDVGMTGEITLRGQVLPVGGIKEKVLAAHRSGLKMVVLPVRNEPDLEDVPDEVKAEMRFIFAEKVEDVLNAALEALHEDEGMSNDDVSELQPQV
jgi:ATP-dependent Lon protease